ncbi:MAG TPA: glycosyltransferase [Candidatus Paceibacterota bacterium]
MRVLILITKSNWGGAQRYVYDLATNLPKEQFQVEVMAGGEGVMVDRLMEAGIKANGTLPIGRDVNIWQDFKAFLELISLLKNKKPDILHVNSSKIGGLGTLAGRIAGVKKIIFTAHGWAFNENRNVFSKILIKISSWIIVLLSHVTIAVAETVKTQMSEWPWIMEKMLVIHNGIKKEPLFSKENARYELGKIYPRFGEIIKNTLTKDLVIVGSVGELHHIKGYEYALRGIKEMKKKIIYCIIGNGENRANLEKDIQNLELQNSVLLFGNVPRAYEYFKAFDIFLMPSLSEGLPYVLLEAGLASLPIVATAVGGIGEVVDDMSSGILIQPRKPREIAHALEFYLNHKKVQKEHGTEIQKKILNEFPIEKMVKETIETYTKTL